MIIRLNIVQPLAQTELTATPKGIMFIVPKRLTIFLVKRGPMGSIRLLRATAIKFSEIRQVADTLVQFVLFHHYGIGAQAFDGVS